MRVRPTAPPMPDFDGRDRRSTSSEEEPPVVIRDKRKFDADGNLRAGATEPLGRPAPSADAAELIEGDDPVPAPVNETDTQSADLQLADLQLAERTADLQRLSAEYANYRKRVDRDRIVVSEVAAGRVLESLLPVLDDIDRAAQHGDLAGPFKAVAEKIISALSGQGLAPFGEVGDPFDPAIHEAVMHGEGDEVTVPTATTIMRRGYRLKERLLRPAMVGVTDPSSVVAGEVIDVDATDTDS
ncbi:MAG: GrpE protein [Pseudonocardiales bacterium]|nr:GrpE protein [Pseudonocardiales bacterium]